MSGDFDSRSICQVDLAKSTPVDLSYTSLHNRTSGSLLLIQKPHLVFCNCWDVFFLCGFLKLENAEKYNSTSIE